MSCCRAALLATCATQLHTWTPIGVTHAKVCNLSPSTCCSATPKLRPSMQVHGLPAQWSDLLCLSALPSLSSPLWSAHRCGPFTCVLLFLLFSPSSFLRTCFAMWKTKFNVPRLNAIPFTHMHPFTQGSCLLGITRVDSIIMHSRLTCHITSTHPIPMNHCVPSCASPHPWVGSKTSLITPVVARRTLARVLTRPHMVTSFIWASTRVACATSTSDSPIMHVSRGEWHAQHNAIAMSAFVTVTHKRMPYQVVAYNRMLTRGKFNRTWVLAAHQGALVLGV